MVGTSSEGLEPSGCESVTNTDNPIYRDFLLHHNYCAKPKTKSKLKSKHLSVKTKKYKKIVPKTQKLEDLIRPLNLEEEINPAANSELIYGTVDDSNCVTIIINENTTSDMLTHENVNDLTNKSNVCNSINELDTSGLLVPNVDKNGLSPRSVSGSDYGYESLDSPVSLDNDDIWDQSVSELFPSLL